MLGHHLYDSIEHWSHYRIVTSHLICATDGFDNQSEQQLNLTFDDTLMMMMMSMTTTTIIMMMIIIMMIVIVGLIKSQILHLLRNLSETV